MSQYVLPITPPLHFPLQLPVDNYWHGVILVLNLPCCMQWRSVGSSIQGGYCPDWVCTDLERKVKHEFTRLLIRKRVWEVFRASSYFQFVFPLLPFPYFLDLSIFLSCFHHSRGPDAPCRYATIMHQHARYLFHASGKCNGGKNRLIVFSLV